MGLLRHHLPLQECRRRASWPTLPDGSKVLVPGLIVCRQRPATAKGITFLLQEDEYGLVNVIVYPDLYEKQRLHVRSTSILTIEGRLQLAQDNVNIIAEKMHPLEENPYVAQVESDFVEFTQEEEVDPQRVQWVSAPSRDLIETPRLTEADIRAVVPDAHNYR